MKWVLLRVVRVVLSTAYCFLVGVVIMWSTELSVSSGVFIGAFVMLVIGFASMTGNRRTMPLAQMGAATRSVDATSVRINAGINTEVAKVENELSSKKGNRHVERPDLLLDIFLRRHGLELIAAGIIAGVIAFIPYLKYFTAS